MSKKYYLIALIPLVLLAFFVLMTQAFAWISAPSDAAVFGGVLLLALALFILIKMIVYVYAQFK